MLEMLLAGKEMMIDFSSLLRKSTTGFTTIDDVEIFYIKRPSSLKIQTNGFKRHNQRTANNYGCISTNLRDVCKYELHLEMDKTAQKATGQKDPSVRINSCMLRHDVEVMLQLFDIFQSKESQQLNLF